MNSRSRSGFRAGVVLVFILLAVPANTASGQDGLVFSAADETPLVLPPGSVGSRPIQLYNSGTTPVTARLRPDLPTGWSLLIPPASIVIPAGQRVSQLLTFTVPSDAASGRYQIRLGIDADEAVVMVLPVEVLGLPKVSATWLSEPGLVRAGSVVEAEMRVTNTGNAATTWDLSARSSLGLPVSLEPGRLELVAGESASVAVRVQTKDDVTSRLTHVVTVAISVSGEEAPRQQVSLTTDIYPGRSAARAPVEGRLPATLSTTAATEDGLQSAQVALRIPETEIKGHLVEALIRTPDAREQSTFSQPDRYSLRVASSEWTLQLGDHNWGATDLLEIGSPGFGVGGDYRSGRYRGGGFLQKSRRIFPEQQQAFAFASVSVRDNLEVGVNALAKRSFEEGESASLGVSWEPGVQFFHAELAQGWFGEKVGRAAQLNMTLQHKQSMMTLQGEAADDGFLGTIRGARGGSMSTRVVLSDGLRWTSQARVRERRYDLGEAGRAAPTMGGGRTALTLLRSRDGYRASWTVSALGQLNNNTLTDLQREERALESRVALNLRRVGLNASVRRGRSDDSYRAGLDPYWASQFSVFGSRGSFSLNTSVSLLDGPSFYNPVDQERITLGLNLGWDNGSGSRVTLGGLHSEDRLSPQQSFSMADVRIEHEFAFGHVLTLRGRTARTAYETSIRNGSLSASWTVPLSIPVPGIEAARTELPGRVVDAETGLPVEGARINMGRYDAISDADGRFLIRVDEGSAHYLTVDRASIGFDRRPVASMPMSIVPADLPEDGISLAIVRSSEVTIQVAVETGTGGERQSALNTTLDDSDRAGVLVEIRSSFDRLRKVTDRNGQVRFPDLVPGSWKAFIVEASLPPETVSRPDTLSLELTPGNATEGTLTMAPERREVRLVGSGGVSLSGGIRTVESTGLTVERESPEELVPEADQPAQRSGSHVVAEGESLSRLAQRYYDGSARHWVRIWLANRSQISDPALILPGLELSIPPEGPLTLQEVEALKDIEGR